MGLIRQVLLCALLAGAAQADPERIARIDAAFAKWLQANDASGAIAVLRKGDLEHTGDHGLASHAPQELASLSKAITAVCAKQLVQGGALSWDDRLSDLVPGAPDVALGTLVTHTSGLDFDSTQLGMLSLLDAEGAHRAETVLEWMALRPLTDDGAGTFVYNNENYALLGLAIEAATDAPYEVCQDRVLAPAGITADPSPRTGVFLPWGGWAIRPEDYGAFLTHWFDPDHAPLEQPHVAFDWGAYYGSGVFFRTGPAGQNYWHFGGHCFPNRLEAGSFAASWRGDWAVVAVYDICTDWDQISSLDAALANAALGALE